MSLATMTAQFFDLGARSRGESLFSERRVRVNSSGRDHLFAEVKGNNSYEVRISAEDDGLEVWCDCIYFEDHGACKHLWAAMREADRRGALSDVHEVRKMGAEPFDLDFPNSSLFSLMAPKP